MTKQSRPWLDISYEMYDLDVLCAKMSNASPGLKGLNLKATQVMVIVWNFITYFIPWVIRVSERNNIDISDSDIMKLSCCLHLYVHYYTQCNIHLLNCSCKQSYNIQMGQFCFFCNCKLISATLYYLTPSHNVHKTKCL